MLAPFSEREASDDITFKLGLASLKLWQSFSRELGPEFEFEDKNNNFTQIVYLFQTFEI